MVFPRRLHRQAAARLHPVVTVLNLAPPAVTALPRRPPAVTVLLPLRPVVTVLLLPRCPVVTVLLPFRHPEATALLLLCQLLVTEENKKYKYLSETHKPLQREVK
jgi:hypothetical protein